MDVINENRILGEIKRRETLFRRRLTLSFLCEAQDIKEQIESMVQDHYLKIDALASKYQTAIDNYQTGCEQPFVANQTGHRTQDEIAKKSPDIETAGSESMEKCLQSDRVSDTLDNETRRSSADKKRNNSHRATAIPSTSDPKAVVSESAARKLHLRFKNGDNKLINDADYSLWKGRLERKLKAKDCTFLIDPSISPADNYTQRELGKMNNAVMAYICSNLPEKHQRLIKKSENPAQMMKTLDLITEPTTGYKVFGYLDQFANIRFNPTKESVLEFLARFDDLVDKIRKTLNAKLDGFLIRHGLITAIGEACGQIKDHALDKPEMTVNDIRDKMLMEHGFVEENVRRGQSTEEKALSANINPQKRYNENPRPMFPNKRTKLSIDSPKPKCGILGHSSSVCKQREKMCYNCGSFDGHVSRDCPQPPSEFTIRVQDGNRTAYKPKQLSKPESSRTPARGGPRITWGQTKRGIKMPLHQALKSSKGKLGLAINIDSDTEELPFDQQMCWLYDVEVDDKTGKSVTGYPQGSIMSVFEGGTALVTVLNHNVLAQDLIDIHPHLYRNHEPDDLVWAKRRDLLLNEFLGSNADIIALQEVQEDHIEPFYKRLENHGYKGVFKKRTSEEKTDGCALYYKIGVFDLVESEEVEYHQPGIPVLNRPNVAIIAKLRHKLNNKELVIANTHLLYNPKRWNIRLAQIQVLLAELHRIVGTSKSPAVMLVGDLNSEPRSPIITLIEKGFYEADDLILPDDLGILPNCTHKSKSKLYNSKLIISLFDDEEESGTCDNNLSRSAGSTNMPSEQGECIAEKSPNRRDSFLKTPERHKLHHGFNFTSTYNFYDTSYRSEATTYQDRWINVDYMFYSNMSLVSRQRLPTVDECVQYIGYIPNAISPSDHLPLLATYAL